MGIRNFANIPCATCARDTLHFAMKCQECGAITARPVEMYTAVPRRLKARGKTGLYIAAKAIHTSELRRARRAIPTANLERRT